MGREKCERYPKNKRNLLLFGGEIQNLGGEISPPKGPEKNTGSGVSAIQGLLKYEWEDSLDFQNCPLYRGCTLLRGVR